MNPEEDLQVGRRSAETAIEPIRQARALGANLYLAKLNPKDMAPVLRDAPEQIELWLGAQRGHPAFVGESMLAEGVYMALCEALLDQDPDPFRNSDMSEG